MYFSFYSPLLRFWQLDGIVKDNGNTNSKTNSYQSSRSYDEEICAYMDNAYFDRSRDIWTSLNLTIHSISFSKNALSFAFY